MALLNVYPRRTWTNNVYSIPVRLKAKGVVIHHADTPNVTPSTDTNAEVQRVAELLRGIYRWHTQHNGWRDIGYHFFISRGGLVFEARLGSSLALKDGLMVTGAHCPGKNPTHIGICLEGNYQNTDLPSSLWESAVKLIATISYIAGFELNRTNVLLHRDVVSTACPGDVTASKIDAIIEHARRVLQRLREGGK